MSWFAKARALVVKYGPTVGTAVKHVAAFVPGGAIAGDLVESAIKASAEVGKDQIEAETAMKHLATANELHRLAAVFDICADKLGRVVEAVHLHDGEPAEAIQKLIVTQLATDQAVRDGFAQLSRELQRFERVESKLDDVLHRLGYSGDLHASMRLLTQQQQALQSFIEELRGAGLGRDFFERVRQMHSALTALSAGKAAEAAVGLKVLEERFPQSAAVAEAEAVQAALSQEPKRAEAKLTQAARWRPNDDRLADLSRRVTSAMSGPKVDTDTGGAAGDGWRQHFRAGAVIDGWTVTGLLGEGGMGAVFAVEKGGETRAMKVLPQVLSKDAVFAAQFRKEIVILCGLAGLRHVVGFKDHNFHVATGCWYFQMVRVAGESLQTKLDRDGPLTVAAAVTLVRQLAGDEGLTPVHAKGITHRDIKPANVLIAADGTPRLVDFGIAGATDPTAPTVIKAYTAKFAAPEQLRQQPLTAASDVYSLVGMLWYAITRTYPEKFDADELPTELEPLREVLTKGLHDKANRRLVDARALGAMLDAMDVSRLGFVFGSAPIIGVKKRENVTMPELPPGRWPWEMAATCLHTLSGDKANVNGVTFSPDGRLLATACGDRSFSGHGCRTRGGMVKVWEASSGRCLHSLEHDSSMAVYDVAFSPDGRSLAAAGAWTVKVWEATSGKCLITLPRQRDVANAVAFSPDGRLLATANGGGCIEDAAKLWDPVSGHCLRDLSGDSGATYDVAFRPDGRLLASAGGRGAANVWEVSSGQRLLTLSGHSQSLAGVAFSPDGRLLATAGKFDKTARVWEVSSGRCLLTLSGHGDGLSCVSFSPDGRLVATSSWDKTAKVWEVSSGRCLLTLSGHGDGVNGVSFSPDGGLLATASADDTTKVWLLHSEKERPNWAFSEPRLPAKPQLTLTISGNGIAYPGDLAWISFRLENAGKGELMQVWAELRSSSAAFAGLKSVIGMVGPGDAVERCIAVVLPPDHPATKLEAELVFHDAHTEFSQSRPIRFDVQPLPRPDFPVRIRVVNDGSGSSRGSGGRPKRGEWIDVLVNLQNQTGEDLHDLDATLAAVKVGPGVEVKLSREAIGDLPDGSGYEARLTVRLDPKAATGPATFEVRVGTRDGRTFAVEAVTMTVE